MPDSRDDFIIAIRYALLKKGAKQKFSLFFLISLSIAVVTLDKLSVPFVQTTRAVLNDFVYKVSVVASSPGKFASYVNQEKKKHFNVVKKNKILKEEIEILNSKRYNALFLKTENEYLKKNLSLSDDITYENQFSVIARVILDQTSPYLKSLIINKGKKDDIIKGMSVFSNKYLIGTIVESNYLSARVLLITDLNSKIPVMIQDSDVNGILAGSGSKTDLNLEYLPDQFILEPNKIIYTSGKDGYLKTGLPVAETYLSKDNLLKIRSLADPQQASIIHVTKGQF
jgi:rod shape-determining protein MreC